jgi:hypothetical protein
MNKNSTQRAGPWKEKADMRKKAPILLLKITIQELSQPPAINIQASILPSLRYNHPKRSEASWYSKNQTSIRLGVTISIKGIFAKITTSKLLNSLPSTFSTIPLLPNPLKAQQQPPTPTPPHPPTQHPPYSPPPYSYSSSAQHSHSASP